MKSTHKIQNDCVGMDVIAHGVRAMLIITSERTRGQNVWIMTPFFIRHFNRNGNNLKIFPIWIFGANL